MNKLWKQFFYSVGCVVSAAATCFFGFILLVVVGLFFSFLTWLLPGHESEIGLGSIVSLCAAVVLVPIFLLGWITCGLFASLTHRFWKALQKIADL